MSEKLVKFGLLENDNIAHEKLFVSVSSCAQVNLSMEIILICYAFLKRSVCSVKFLNEHHSSCQDVLVAVNDSLCCYY